MSVSNENFETGEKMPRTRHEIVLTVDSPNSISKEMNLSVKGVAHVAPAEKEVVLAPACEQEDEAVEEALVEEAAPAAEEALVEEAAPAAEEALVEEAAPATEEAVAEEVAPAVEEPAPQQIVTPVPVSVQAPAEEKPAAPVRKRRRGLSLTTKKALSGWLFVLPFIIGIIFIYAPIVFNSLRISLSDYTPSREGMLLEWNGFANYSYIFTEDPYFSITIVDGIKDLILQIPAIVIFALFMAIILNQKMTGRAVFRAIFFLPVILSTGIIDTIDSNSTFMQAISNSQGGVDDNTGAESGGIISALDLEQLLGGIKIGTELVDYVVSLVNSIFDIVSRSGVQMLIFLSGLQSISPAIYESCEVEGASAWETFWKITLPMISPMILVNAIYTVIDAFTAADNRVMVYIEKIYNYAQYENSSAMSWVYVGVVLLFILLVALIMKTVVFYQRRD